MGILRIAIYDNNLSRMCDIENIIKATACKKNWKRFSIMKISKIVNMEKILQYAQNDLVFIALDSQQSINFAAEIYRKNAFCKTVYYTYNQNFDINQILLGRPFACVSDSEYPEKIISILNDELFSFDSKDGFLFVENRTMQIFLPINKIIYFSSHEHYVSVVYGDDTPNDRFNKKLDAIQEVVSDCLFVRIHKSYLVSVLHILNIDKSSHMIKMDNGDILPISDSYYKSTVEKTRQFCSLKP